jgi:menaquinone-dependent protoporphyrinogen oxidase
LVCGVEVIGVAAGQGLIVYATKRGGTAAIAQRLGTALTQHGIDVDVRHVDDVERIDGYDVVIVGSPIVDGRWRPEAVSFLRGHRRALKSRLVWLFHAGHPISESDNIELPRRVISEARRVGAIGVQTLAGAPGEVTADNDSSRTLSGGIANDGALAKWARLIARRAQQRAGV